MDVGMGDKGTFPKAFSSWTFKEVCDHILKIDLTNISELPELEIDELGEQKKLLKEDYKKFVDAVEETQFFFDVKYVSNEYEKKPLLLDYFKTVLKHILKEKKIHIKCRIEKELAGTYGCGRVNYCFQYREIILVVIEAKKNDFEKGVSQAIVEMNVVLENIQKKGLKYQTMYGIVSNAFVWIFLQFTKTATGGAKVKISKAIFSCMREHEIVFDWILRILEIQLKNLTDIGVNLKTINPEQCPNIEAKHLRDLAN